MKGDPVAVVQADKGRDLTSAEKTQVTSTLKKAQDSIKGDITGDGGKIQAQMQSAYNGFQASVPAAKLDTLAALPGVVAIHRARTYTLDNAVSVPFLGVPAVWQNTGYTGKGVKVAIIDTGIDYTHADFGGPGTVAAFTKAAATSASPADPALFGPYAPRVKGGTDLVGDAYDAAGTGAALIPQPDSNPLDCEGHGSHVAGTAVGGGVTSTKAPYRGPYNTATAKKSFIVGPGVAPQADIYSVRVFGCAGSTDVIVPAIDWAVAHGMNVINMSLGSSFGRAGDPDAVAASNAVGAGVVVVASAGNSGVSPYLTGSPATGDGVIGVSAVDGTATFPGATLTVGAARVPAINANAAPLTGVGTLSTVRLVDDPATAENEALGCSVEAYKKAGIAAGKKQLAVSVRGTCARAAKAIFAQQAGAAAALMINNVAELPPFEGIVKANPDSGAPFALTIPFLGVSSADATSFVKGAKVTMTATTIANPDFRAYASFTSSGPRSGDSAISPDVAAPGVSISSVAVGTGSDSTILSGTSMASPHVAGVAALSVQAHPMWSAAQVASTLVATADPDKVPGQNLVLGGVGLVDAAQAVATKVTATGDAFHTDSGWARESALSFGFQESALGFGGVKTITVRNDGAKPVTYRLSSVATAQSKKAKVVLSAKSVTVKPGRTAKVLVTVLAAAKDIPTSVVDTDPFALYEISGDVVLTASGSTLRVPYLLVPRSNSTVHSATSHLFSGSQPVTTTTKKVSLNNYFGALDGNADVYTWGLSDPKDASKSLDDTGYDLRAAGVQTQDTPDGPLLVFALNMHHRWSNAAANEYDIPIDTNGDGKPDWIVYSADSGSVRTGDVNGTAEVFIVNTKTHETAAAGFFAQAPTDSSTILLPVYASDLGITGSFGYTAETFGGSGGEDTASGSALYDPTARALSDGQFVTVPKRGSTSVSIAVNGAEYAKQKPLGSMVVVYDNHSGADEALLVKTK